jgi:hypothetical protein
MNDPMEAILQPSLAPVLQYPLTSRYYGIASATYTRADGSVVLYLRRRFLPDPADLQTLQFHTVTQGERLDNIAANALGDPLQFWRIADANYAMRPEALTETVGKRVRISLPAGVTGAVAG